MNIIYKTRNSIIRFLYAQILKPIFFSFDPEKVHNAMSNIGVFMGKFGLFRWKVSLLLGYRNKMLHQIVSGISFNNPIGLSAGFDKDINLTDITPSVGFGFEEVGSVTARSYVGNPKPRLWRLKKTKSLGVWFGLKNEGVEILAPKLAKKNHRIPIGVNVAFTNCKENLEVQNAIKDYVLAFMAMEKHSDYMVVNLSCPNTYGGMPFLIPENYENLMVEIDKIDTLRPVFVKISPDMTHQEIDRFLEVSSRHRVNGIICSNLTKKPDPNILMDPLPPHGGLSGKLVFPKAIDLLSYMYKKMGNKFIFIFCGGVFSADDAYKAIRQGATLVELITGMIFEGPQLISEINHGLVERLRRDGFKNIHEAIGVDNIG